MSASRWSEARARCDAATPGPWQNANSHVVAPDQDQNASFALDGDIFGDNHRADATFIAHARTDLPAALDAIDAVLALHQRQTQYQEGDRLYQRSVPSCGHCSSHMEDVAYPCPTVCALGVEE